MSITMGSVSVIRARLYLEDCIGGTEDTLAVYTFVVKPSAATIQAKC